MSIPNLTQGDEDNEEEIPPHRLVVGSAEVRTFLHHRVSNVAAVKKCEDDISELKEQLDDKEKELESLRKKVKDLEENNNELQLQLKLKCNQVEDLKSRIQKLEDDKKSLQEQLALVSLQLKNITDDVKTLSKSKSQQDDKNVELEGKLQKIQLTLKEVEEDLKSTQEENKSLKAKVKKVQNGNRYVQGAQLCLPVPANDQNKAMLQLAELSSQIQDIMYQKVLPNHYTPVLRYTVKSIEKDIQRLLKTDAEREEATSRWEKLKSELQWDDDKTEVLESLRESRTVVEAADEKLEERKLREYTKFLEKEGILKGWLRIDHITALIDAWARLKSSDK